MIYKVGQHVEIAEGEYAGVKGIILAVHPTYVEVDINRDDHYVRAVKILYSSLAGNEEIQRRWILLNATNPSSMPKKIHTSIESAQAEQERLAQATPNNTFILFESISELVYEQQLIKKETIY